MPIYLLMNFIIYNQETFQTNSSVQNNNINTRNRQCLHRQNANLSHFQKKKKNTFYAGIKIFNSLPSSVTILKNKKAKSKVIVRKHLNAHSFYYADEFLCAKLMHYYYIQKFYNILLSKLCTFCTFMASSTSYCLWYTYRSMKCVCVCVCIHACMCVCVCHSATSKG
jgi:hypothetical protein